MLCLPCGISCLADLVNPPSRSSQMPSPSWNTGPTPCSFFPWGPAMNLFPLQQLKTSSQAFPQLIAIVWSCVPSPRSSSRARASSYSFCRNATSLLKQIEVWLVKVPNLSDIWVVREPCPKYPTYLKFSFKDLGQKIRKEQAYTIRREFVQH